MVYQRLIRSVMLLSIAGLTFAACGSNEPQTPQQKYCTAKCNCNKCTPSESATCLDDIINLADEAKGADCKDPYETYLTCLNEDGACTDGDFDESSCYNEETDLRTCIKPPPACMTVGDGICNEPAPKGDGTCATGTDTMDCMAPPPVCVTAGDGVCDEPPPAGNGTCAAGSDTLDCAGMCKKCFTYALDQTTGTLCDTSTSLFSALYECACSATCSASCGGLGDICDNGQLSSSCYNCVSSQCATSYNACVQDG